MAVRTDIHAHIDEVVIDRPPVNALDSKAWKELAAVITNMGSKPEVRCLLLRGEGKGFCASADTHIARDTSHKGKGTAK